MVRYVPNKELLVSTERKSAMKALMIIESWFGNTRTVGEEIAQILRDRGTEVRVVNVQDAPSRVPAGTELRILGAPTHSRGLPTAATREKAASAAQSAGQSAEAASTGMREWLGSATIESQQKVVVFDTVTAKNWIAGSAAKAAAKVLRSRLPQSSVDVRSFVVRGTQGPLAPGEIDAARRWGEELARS